MPTPPALDADAARRTARRRLPRLVFDYVDGAAGREAAAARNVARLGEITLRARAMAAVGTRSLRTRLLGREHAAPFGIAPMGMCALACPHADRLMAEAATEAGIPVVLSSYASASIEEMRAWAGPGAWFQLYGGPTEAASMALVARAEAAGYDTLVLTVDVPQVARRPRDARNGFSVPFRIGPRQALDFALHPRWSLATLRAGAPRPVNFDGGPPLDRGASRAGADWDFLDRLRARWPGALLVKGLGAPEDALRARDAGADAVWVSNHGGRQLDAAPAAIDLLPDMRAALGPAFPILFDSGIRSGEDVARALAMGADFAMMGRPVLWALAARGGPGLRAYLAGVAADLDVALAQLGLSDVAQLGADALHRPGAWGAAEPLRRRAR